MEDPFYLTLFQSDDKEREPRILETPISIAHAKGQAMIQNDLATKGTSTTLLAGSVRFWQQRVNRALFLGMITGGAIVGAVAFFWN